MSNIISDSVKLRKLFSSFPLFFSLRFSLGRFPDERAEKILQQINMKTLYRRIMIVDFYDYVELLSKAVYEISLASSSFLSPVRSAFRRSRKHIFYDHPMRERRP